MIWAEDFAPNLVAEILENLAYYGFIKGKAWTKHSPNHKSGVFRGAPQYVPLEGYDSSYTFNSTKIHNVQQAQVGAEH